MEVRRLEMQLPAELLTLAGLFKEAGHQLYVVGGAVRDTLLGQVPKDFDVATDATPEQIKAFLAPHNYSMLSVGESFGVTMIVFPFPLEKLEIATFREDMSAGRHPIVRYATIHEDVQRRDLTINALFYDINTQQVFDLVGGLSDMERRLLCAVGEPADRFREDPLRKLRAIRFATRLSYQFEIKTENAILRDPSLEGVSAERIRDEFVRGIATAQSVRKFLVHLEYFGMWAHVFPGLRVNRVPDSMSSSSGPESRHVPVILSILLEGNAPEVVTRVLNSLKYTAHEIALTTFLMRFRDINEAAAYRMRRQFNSLNVNDDVLIDYASNRNLPTHAVFGAFLDYRLTVSGDALIAEGFSGAALGRELEQRERILFQQLLGTH